MSYSVVQKQARVEETMLSETQTKPAKLTDQSELILAGGTTFHFMPKSFTTLRPDRVKPLTSISSKGNTTHLLTKQQKPDWSWDKYNYKNSSWVKWVNYWLGFSKNYPLTLHSDLLITSSSLCPSDSTLDYLMMIKSSVGHWSRRQAIRETFGKTGLFKHLSSRIVFLLGISENFQKMKTIQAEASQHNDIVQGDFVDTYRNLTLKGVMGLRWVHENCPNVKVIMNMDDDSFVNIFSVVHRWIPSFAMRYHSIKCKVYFSYNKAIKRSNSHDKWVVDDKLFPGLPRYPMDHCNGLFVLMTGDLVTPMLAAARVNPVFWIDDVYLFGLLTKTVGDVTHEIWGTMNDRVETTQSKQGFIKSIKESGILGTKGVVVNNNELTDADFIYLWEFLLEHLTDSQRQKFKISENV